MSRTRFTSSLLLGTALFLTVAATPAQAFSNPFPGMMKSAQEKLTRVYLVLPGNKPGKTVLQESFKASEAIKTINYTANLEAKVLDSKDKELLTGKLDFSGPAEVKEVTNPADTKQDVNLKGEFTVEGVVVRADADLKIDDATQYWKINEMPPVGNFSTLKGKWLRLTDPTLEAAETEQTPEQEKAVEDAATELIKDSQVGEAKKTKVDGHDVFEVQVTIPSSALTKYIETVEKIQNTDEKTNKQLTDAGMDPSDPEVKKTLADAKAKQKEQMQKFFNATKPIVATITIDRKTLYMRKFDLPLEVDLASLIPAEEKAALSNPTPIGDLSDVKTLKLDMKATINEFNQPVNFTTPADAEDFTTAIGKAMGNPAMMEETTMPTRKMTAPNLKY